MNLSKYLSLILLTLFFIISLTVELYSFNVILPSPNTVHMSHKHHQRHTKTFVTNIFQLCILKNIYENYICVLVFTVHISAECSISTQGSSKHCAHYTISLPNWKVPKGEGVQEFYKTLREDLNENVNIMFQQAAKISCNKIGISTSQIHDSKYPFPLDVIAEAVVGHSVIFKHRTRCSSML